MPGPGAIPGIFMQKNDLEQQPIYPFIKRKLPFIIKKNTFVQVLILSGMRIGTLRHENEMIFLYI